MSEPSIDPDLAWAAAARRARAFWAREAADRAAPDMGNQAENDRLDRKPKRRWDAEGHEIGEEQDDG